MSVFTYFNRDTKVYVELNGNFFEIPVLADHSYSQGVSSTQIGLNEAEDSSGTSVRGQVSFNEALNAVEWNFSAYLRPTLDSTSSRHFLVDEVLWAALAGATSYDTANAGRGFHVGATAPTVSPFANTATASNSGSAVTFRDSTGVDITFQNSNKSALSDDLHIYFVVGPDQNSGTDGIGKKVFKVTEAAVNEASLSFDLEGITQVAWSGFGKELEDVTVHVVDGEAPSVALTNKQLVLLGGEVKILDDSDGVDTATNVDADDLVDPFNKDVVEDKTDNLIRTRVTGLTVNYNSKNYNIAVTGGTLTINNNLTYLVPEELGKVNVPLRHVTGTRSISGDFTCYLKYNVDTDGSSVTDMGSNDYSGNFWADLIANSSDEVQPRAALTFDVGGTTAGNPQMKFTLAQAAVEIPTHSIEDIISLSCNFTGLGSTITATDEITMTAKGV